METKIFVSGDLDEYLIADLLARRAPIEAFGVGTALVTSKDAPSLGGVYKLVDIEADGTTSYRAKFSDEKVTHPGRKQVFRFHDNDGSFHADVIACADEQFPNKEPLVLAKKRQDSGKTSDAMHPNAPQFPSGGFANA